MDVETLSLLKSSATLDLSLSKGDVSIAVVDRHNLSGSVDQLGLLGNLISANENMYPGIDRWFSKKVLPGLQCGERKAYLLFEHEKPIAAAVLKLGVSAKLCHLWINENHQGLSLGQLLLVQMTLDTLECAKDIHFTLPETLWTSKKQFFRSFGFLQADKTSLKYRRGEAELSCSAPVSRVYSAAVRKISGLLRRLSLKKFPGQSDLLMSVKPNFAEKVLDGSKSIEIRKQFSNKWTNHEVVLYATKPLGSLVGKAQVGSVTRGQPEHIWSCFEGKIGCSKSEFDAYVGSSKEIAAIQLKNVCSYDQPVRLDKISNLLGEVFRPPQSYFSFSSNQTKSWLNAVYLANFLHHKAGLSANSKLPS